MRDGFQRRVRAWLDACLGPAIAADRGERSDRLLEEALEVVQSLGYPKDRALRMVDDVYAREPGDTTQEVGGLTVCLAALAEALGFDAGRCGDDELDRIRGRMAEIRDKQRAKLLTSGHEVPDDDADVRVRRTMGVRHGARSREENMLEAAERMANEELAGMPGVTFDMPTLKRVREHRASGHVPWVPSEDVVRIHGRTPSFHGVDVEVAVRLMPDDHDLHTDAEFEADLRPRLAKAATAQRTRALAHAKATPGAASEPFAADGPAAAVEVRHMLCDRSTLDILLARNGTPEETIRRIGEEVGRAVRQVKSRMSDYTVNRLEYRKNVTDGPLRLIEGRFVSVDGELSDILCAAAVGRPLSHLTDASQRLSGRIMQSIERMEPPKGQKGANPWLRVSLTPDTVLIGPHLGLGKPGDDGRIEEEETS